jgi:hypothetical protein
MSVRRVLLQLLLAPLRHDDRHHVSVLDGLPMVRPRRRAALKLLRGHLSHTRCDPCRCRCMAWGCGR